jgi:hypothetical protein
MNKENFAVLVRGFCINLSKKPQMVISEVIPKAAGANIPAAAMMVETGNEEDKASAACTIQSSYEAWKKSNASYVAGGGKILLPSCVALCANGKTETLYWIGTDLDSARKRLSEKDASPEILSACKIRITIDP